MRAAPRTTPATPASIAEPVYLENTLLRVFGVLFCHDPKRARQRTGTLAVNRGVKEKSIAVRLDPEYAQPGPFAHKVAVAIIRKQSNYGRPARRQISFTQRELGRLCGRQTFGGRDSEEVTLALRQIRYTHVLAHFKRGDRFVEHDFSIFNEIMIERRSAPTDPIVACTIVLAEPIIQSLDDRHFTCLNHALMQQLGTVGQALYMRLFFHFATHYDGHHRERVVFKKRYDDICTEWLGGLTVLVHRSKILGEQLGVHLDQLVKVGFLRSYQLTPAEVRAGFVLTFRPGTAFFADYQRFYTRNRGDVRFDLHELEAADGGVGDPHRLAYLFVEKRTGRRRDQIPFVSSKDVATAKALLAQLPMADMPDFLDYALAEAAKTRFDLQTLGGVRQYLNRYLAERDRRAAGKASATAREAEVRATQLRLEYSEFRRAEADKLFRSLPARERSAIEAQARAESAPKGRAGGLMAETLFKMRRAQITAERHAARLTSFDDWQRAHRQHH